MIGSGLTPWMEQEVAQLLAYAASQGINAHVSAGLRTCAEQNAIYEGGAGVATTVKGCDSWHVWGRAVDLVIDGPFSDYAVLGAEWKRMGGVWGGDWKVPDDPGHFEWHPDLAIHEVCPTGTECPSPGPWPEDRPLMVRPAVRIAGGLLLAASGLGLAFYMSRR